MEIIINRVIGFMEEVLEDVILIYGGGFRRCYFKGIKRGF